MSVGNVNMDELIAKLVARMDDCREKIDVCDLNANAEQLKNKLAVFSIIAVHFSWCQFMILMAVGPLFLIQKMISLGSVIPLCCGCCMICDVMMMMMIN